MINGQILTRLAVLAFEFVAKENVVTAKAELAFSIPWRMDELTHSEYSWNGPEAGGGGNGLVVVDKHIGLLKDFKAEGFLPADHIDWPVGAVKDKTTESVEFVSL